MDIVIVTTARTDEEATEFLTADGTPAAKGDGPRWQRRASIEKSKRTPKFACAQHNRCLACGRPRGYLPQVRACAGSASARTRIAAFVPGVTKASGKANGQSITDPIADMLTRIRNANTANHKTVDIPASRMKRAIARNPQRRRLHPRATSASAKARKARSASRSSTARKKKRSSPACAASARPGLRVYTSQDRDPARAGRSRSGHHVDSARASCPASARSAKAVGGEVLAYVW